MKISYLIILAAVLLAGCQQARVSVDVTVHHGPVQATVTVWR